MPDAERFQSQAAPQRSATMPQMKKWLRFSLRTMLVLITALCIWLGVQVNVARRQREAVAAISRVGGTVYYDYQLVPVATGVTSLFEVASQPSDDGLDLSRTPPGADWLRKCLGDDFFRTAVVVWFPNNPNPNIAKGNLDQLARFPCLRSLQITDCNIRDADLSALAALMQLEVLRITDTRVNGSILASLPSPGRLKGLYLNNPSNV